uniref:Uncharacterized protein n=1 Tax=Chromera velia CCMP2878 TaxID=1169474 RepID=A0A0G4I352_9ALVE|eukprot:Cvel_10565.t1-p1 / transcript=Cvel_10565.t1 / gene=Cvel_10565 / organism=Chromera_velia_CCMP2878 / gene_product=hypothetical protein / transcript_product=hypothetical protein / location=Cvel_scaffold640:10236-13283(+) / protein_length=144 / sequence_SO=supercontig / SO=protein_coding / is_pseudo=false
MHCRVDWCSSVAVFPTDAYSVDFACLEDDGEIRGAFFLDIKPKEEDSAILVAALTAPPVFGIFLLKVTAPAEQDLAFLVDAGSSSPAPNTGLVECDDRLIVVPAGTEFSCMAHWASTQSLTQPEIEVTVLDEVLVQFSDGTHTV